MYTQVVWITGKAMRADRPPRPPPFDYRNKSYTLLSVWTDPMEKRLDDNSKIVVIEGLPGSGKNKFAKQLAEELEMEYMQPPSFDDFLINYYGFDYRTLNSQLPVDAQYFDDKTFHADPTGRNSTSMQITWYLLRLNQYMEALTHVLSTGQGVVLNRCPWSDMVFMKAMCSNKYVNKPCFQYYKDSVAASIDLMLRPHLVIYLDIPSTVSKVKNKKKKILNQLSFI